MKVQNLLTSAARRHIRLFARAILPSAGRMERRFRAILRERGYDAAHTREILAVSPVVAARSLSMGQFFEAVGYHGRRLARLNVELDATVALLAEFGQAVDEILGGGHAPAREQLQLATAHALQSAWYQVREGEAQVFYDLAYAEAKAEGLDDLLDRVVKILTRAFGARAGRVQLQDSQPDIERYSEEPSPGWPDYVATWSFPVRSMAVIQLAFDKPYPWLPRERTMMRAVAERCAAAMERSRMNAEMVRLEAEARRAEEEERRRIGRELHDDTAQSLLLLRLQLEMMEREAPEAWRARLEQSRAITERAIEDLRRTIAALSPALLERLGLESALRQLAARFSKRHPAGVDVRVSPAWDELAPGAQEVIYRVAQESLQNIAKHSRATRVNLRLSSADKKFRLRVCDNGTGFSPELAMGKPLSFGLAGMRERAALLGGTLAVRSIPGKGATVTLELPRSAATGEN
ncbi:MAG TPA: sensor histidine kinase [Candidatus Acidoferrum sp.]|nr:sensor histidine kinase [Candidatus Acidoferrum sp.]